MKDLTLKFADCHTYCPDSGVNHDAGSVFVDDTDGI